MTLKQLFIIPLIITIGIFPPSLNSADIYEPSKGNGKIVDAINDTIISGENKLDSTVLFIRSEEEYRSPGIFSKCANSQKLVYSGRKDSYFIYGIYINFLIECTDNNVYISNGDEIYKDSEYRLNIFNYAKYFDQYTNYSNSKITDKLKELEIYSMKNDEMLKSLVQKNDVESKFQKFKYTYYNGINNYKTILLTNLLSTRRNLAYISPISGKSMPTKKNLIPNAPRPYRSKYTDGIHHGWDIFAERGTPVRSLAEGLIIRIKSDFSWNDFDTILWKDLGTSEKMKNLDVYRGNQVWLKTPDGNVTFYSHLGKIGDIRVGDYVKADRVLGYVDSSGVPDKGYKDFHLHFEVQVNPLDKDTCSEEDIMNWNYFGKDESTTMLLYDQSRLFRANYAVSQDMHKR